MSRPNPVRTRPGRRLLVGALALFNLVLLAMSALGVTTPLSFAVVGLILATDILLLYVTRKVADLPDSAVDEREEAVRNHAYRLSYRAVMYMSVFAAGLVAVLASLGDPNGVLHTFAANTALVIAACVAGSQLIAFLPTMVLAWTESDPEE
jgi:hypothetical protein